MYKAYCLWTFLKNHSVNLRSCCTALCAWSFSFLFSSFSLLTSFSSDSRLRVSRFRLDSKSVTWFWSSGTLVLELTLENHNIPLWTFRDFNFYRKIFITLKPPPIKQQSRFSIFQHIQSQTTNFIAPALTPRLYTLLKSLTFVAALRLPRQCLQARSTQRNFSSFSQYLRRRYRRVYGRLLLPHFVFFAFVAVGSHLHEHPGGGVNEGRPVIGNGEFF